MFARNHCSKKAVYAVAQELQKVFRVNYLYDNLNVHKDVAREISEFYV